MFSASYYPLWLRVESPNALPEGPDELIESLGHKFFRGVGVFSAPTPTPEETELLNLHAGCR